MTGQEKRCEITPSTALVSPGVWLGVEQLERGRGEKWSSSAMQLSSDGQCLVNNSIPKCKVQTWQ